ncbi:MAG: AAA family ATPase [Geitlerinemataceae cyanobacterium]
MTLKLEHLGAIRYAEFSLGDLTIICGGNNTGKTYATYALFGFVDNWRELVHIPVDDESIANLITNGTLEIDLEQYVEQAQSIIDNASEEYKRWLPGIFASQVDLFKKSSFNVCIDSSKLRIPGTIEQRARAGETEVLTLSKTPESTVATMSLLAEEKKIRIPVEVLRHMIQSAIKDAIFAELFPRPFIASTERTGAAIFRKELDFARNRLLDAMSRTDQSVDPRQLMLSGYQDYALPVEENVEFTRKLEILSRKSSFIREEHSDILNDFSDIIGGQYSVKESSLVYTPRGNKKLRLSMDESSSSIRSLLIVGFYLRHEAMPGDLLIIDEPELNLHPENQRRLARLFARLIRVGIKVFITTHSDYIIKELNTLIMLNQDSESIKNIREKEDYRDDELISSDSVKVYITEKSLTKIPGRQKRLTCQTLVPAKVSPELGIDARSFDSTIEDMNRIQESILWPD